MATVTPSLDITLPLFLPFAISEARIRIYITLRDVPRSRPRQGGLARLKEIFTRRFSQPVEWQPMQKC
ncbi:hypothetical protein E2C01_083922 [Portunus trituberculatus]|uniref:Uncharacterized protein n=1 Tax=Portunus trituberculatus TaxID=210409 RepID=A0A5B7J9B3_PORTR|nr:hypothetical protein [Portunus trituberculatus]